MVACAALMLRMPLIHAHGDRTTNLWAEWTFRTTTTSSYRAGHPSGGMCVNQSSIEFGSRSILTRLSLAQPSCPHKLHAYAAGRCRRLMFTASRWVCVYSV